MVTTVVTGAVVVTEVVVTFAVVAFASVVVTFTVVVVALVVVTFAVVVVVVVVVGLFLPFEGQRFYMFFVHCVKYMFSVKRYTKDNPASQANIDNFLPFKNVKDGYIEYADYYAGVLQIDPREFSLLSEYRQDQIIDDNFGRIIREIADKTKASIVK